MLGHLSSCMWLMSHCLATCELDTHTETVPCGLTHVPGCCPYLTRCPRKKPSFAKTAGRADHCHHLYSFQPPR